MKGIVDVSLAASMVVLLALTCALACLYKSTVAIKARFHFYIIILQTHY